MAVAYFRSPRSCAASGSVSRVPAKIREQLEDCPAALQPANIGLPVCLRNGPPRLSDERRGYNSGALVRLTGEMVLAPCQRSLGPALLACRVCQVNCRGCQGWTVTLGTYCTSGTDQHSGGYADARDSSAASIPGHHGADIPAALPSVLFPCLACNRGRRSGGGPTCDRILARQRGDSSGHTYCRVCVEGDDCGLAGPDCDCDRLAGCSISPEPRGESDGSLA